VQPIASFVSVLLQGLRALLAHRDEALPEPPEPSLGRWLGLRGRRVRCALTPTQLGLVLVRRTVGVPLSAKRHEAPQARALLQLVVGKVAWLSHSDDSAALTACRGAKIARLSHELRHPWAEHDMCRRRLFFCDFPARCNCEPATFRGAGCVNCHDG
jgi:hypothetical protein